MSVKYTKEKYDSTELLDMNSKEQCWAPRTWKGGTGVHTQHHTACPGPWDMETSILIVKGARTWEIVAKELETVFYTHTHTDSLAW